MGMPMATRLTRVILMGSTLAGSERQLAAYSPHFHSRRFSVGQSIDRPTQIIMGFYIPESQFLQAKCLVLVKLLLSPDLFLKRLFRQSCTLWT